MRRLATGAVAAAVLASTLANTDGHPGAFAAAVLRRDGALIPIGAFTGRKWDVSWPAEPYDKLEIPITLDAVPQGWWGKVGRRDEWQLWTDGKPTMMVHVVSPQVVATMCTGRMALTTDYRSADAPPRTVQPYPKVGIVVSPPVPIGRIETLTARSPEWQGIATALKQAFDEEEDRLAATWTRAGDPHPIGRKERLQTALTIEAMYASDDGRDRLYYVEASREYDHSNDERALCAVAFGGVFFRREGNTARPLGGEIRVVPCDRRGLLYMLPFGAVRVRDTTFWLTQYSGWNFEQYNIIQFERTRAKVVASTFGGSC